MQPGSDCLIFSLIKISVQTAMRGSGCLSKGGIWHCTVFEVDRSGILLGQSGILTVQCEHDEWRMMSLGWLLQSVGSGL